MCGALIAIGGALRPDGPILPEFYRRSGGANGRIVILPTASGLPDSGFAVAQALSRLGLRSPARVLPLRSRKDAERPDFCSAMREASGLFITGGDQARLPAVLCGTAFYGAIQDMFRCGGTVAGTSAGTAALSTLMIVRGNSGALPRHNIAQFSTGLGLIDTCIFDQHFRQRNRIGRLLYAVACHPSLLGIGVDENTAAVIDKNVLSVIGSGTVTLVDGRAVTCWDTGSFEGSECFSLSGVQLHIFTTGGRYDLQHYQPIEGASV